MRKKGQMFLDMSKLSFSLSLFFSLVTSNIRGVDGASYGGRELTMESAVIGGKVSLLCPGYVDGPVTWQFNDPSLTSPTTVAANGKIDAKYSDRFSLEKPGPDAHILVIAAVTSSHAGLYSCYPDDNVVLTKYVFLRVSFVGAYNDTTVNGTDAGTITVTVTTPSQSDPNKDAVSFYLVLLAIIFAIFFGVMIVMCVSAQKSRFLKKKTDQSAVDAEQQKLQPSTSTAGQPGPSTAAAKS